MIKVLFVASGNSKTFDMAPFIKAQAESLRALGVDVQYFLVKAKGFSGYLRASSKLRNLLVKNSIDIIHAHYTLSGWTAVLSLPKQPIVLSLMGSDAYGEYIGVNKIQLCSRYLTSLTYLIQPFVSSIICKSKNIESFVYLKQKSYVIPNGIMLDKFTYHENGFRKELGLDLVKKHILFLGNKENRRKNFNLLEAAVNLINSDDIYLVAPYPISHDQVVKYLNSVEVLVLPSLMEGSPNLVKEAMACNCPMVATDVGDVRWVIGDTPGCFLASFDPEDMANKIILALEYSRKHGRSKGRNRIIELGLDSKTIAKRILHVYKNLVN